MPTLAILARLCTIRHRCALRALALVVVACCASASARAAGPDVLAECMALSSEQDDIHACLDNYLDVMDDNIRDITAFIQRELDGTPRIAFERAQAAFETYRRENCLWYLAFSTPRRQAEQIAKNCLARMSIDRLAELQALLARGDTPSQAIDGYYVFGNNRNSFRPCGSERRLWVDGDDGAVATLQQQYLENTTAELQLMFASVTGTVGDDANGRAEHDGVLMLQSVRALRVPSDADCRLPSGSPPVTAATPDDTSPAPTVEERLADAAPVQREPDPAPAAPARVNPVADPDSLPALGTPPAAPVERDERLTAYFGAWLADCTDDGERAGCRLAVAFDGGGNAPELSLRRREDGTTTVRLSLPDGAASLADEVRWSIDGYGFGSIDGARLRSGDEGLELVIEQRGFVRDELLPLMRDGGTVSIETGGDGRRRSATLMGLTRALGFADDYLGVDG